jgi:hypothetical protein
MSKWWHKLSKQAIPASARHDGRRQGIGVKKPARRHLPALEGLEDRVTPAVTWSQSGGALSVFLGATNRVPDSAELQGGSAAGDQLHLFGNGSFLQTFDGVTSISVFGAGAN